MTILASTSDVIRIVTGSAVSTIEVQANYTDLSGSTYTPGSTETEITTATTTTVVAAPGSSVFRKIKNLTIRNNSTSSCQVTVQHFNGTIAADMMGVTLLAGETLIKADNGKFRHLTSAGAEYAWGLPAKGTLGISGAKAETMPRMLCTEANGGALGSGGLQLYGIYLAAGTVVSSISFFSATTAAGTPTNQFFALYGPTYALLAQSANDTTTAWAANSIKTLNMTTPYTVPVSGRYFIGIMITATTVPTLKCYAGGSTLALVVQSLRGSSNTGLTTSLPDPCNAPTSVGSNVAWACVS